MSLSCSGPVAARSCLRVSKFLAVTAIGCLAGLVVAGCASKSTTSYDARPPQHVAAAKPAEMEDDGREAQPAAPRHLKSQPDDPREPWSPNYGGPSPRPLTPAVPPPARAAMIPDDLPPDFRKRLVTRAD